MCNHTVVFVHGSLMCLNMWLSAVSVPLRAPEPLSSITDHNAVRWQNMRKRSWRIRVREIAHE
jgi:hypothetical protein